MPPCVTCVPCGVEYDRSFHVFVVIDRFKILTHTHPTPLTQTSISVHIPTKAREDKAHLQTSQLSLVAHNKL